MRKYQQKLLNQNYMAHLSNLRLIRNRKPLNQEGVINRISHQEHFLEKKNLRLENERLLKSIENPKRALLSRGANPKRNQSAQQKQKKLRFQNNLLENKILNAESIVSTFQQTLPNLNPNKPWNKMAELSNFTRMEKLKQFLAQDRKQNIEIGKGHSKIIIKIVCLDIFNSKISKEHQNHISFVFYIGNEAYRSKLIEPSKLSGQQFHIKFSKFNLSCSQILVSIQQYRGIYEHPLGYFKIEAKQLLNAEEKVYSKFVHKNKQEPLGLMEYEMTVQL